MAIKLKLHFWDPQLYKDRVVCTRVIDAQGWLKFTKSKDDPINCINCLKWLKKYKWSDRTLTSISASYFMGEYIPEELFTKK